MLLFPLLISFTILWKHSQYINFPFLIKILTEVPEKGAMVIIDFSPLWRTMDEKGITQYKLLKSGIDNKTLDTLKKNHNITLLTLEKLCKILDCTPNDVIEFTND